MHIIQVVTELFTALALDHRGFLLLPRKPMSWARVVGVLV
eukprot:SAG31_NODE_43388_length_267_cov_0.803571_1_plen_39_part_10